MQKSHWKNIVAFPTASRANIHVIPSNTLQANAILVCEIIIAVSIIGFLFSSPSDSFLAFSWPCWYRFIHYYHQRYCVSKKDGGTTTAIWNAYPCTMHLSTIQKTVVKKVKSSEKNITKFWAFIHCIKKTEVVAYREKFIKKVKFCIHFNTWF